MIESLSVFQTGIKQQLGLETPNVDMHLTTYKNC